MSDLEKRLEEDSKYKQEEQEYDGALSYNLPTPKDLTNYYPPSANVNVERYEKAILNTNGEVPSAWVLSLTSEQIDELNSYSPDFVNELSSVSNYYDDLFDVENDIQEIVLSVTDSTIIDTNDELSFEIAAEMSAYQDLFEQNPMEDIE